MSNYTKFLIGDWDPEAEKFISLPTVFVHQVWGRLVALKPPPGDDEGECLAVAKAAEQRTKKRIKEIQDQDCDWLYLVLPMLSALPGGPLTKAEAEKSKPWTMKMLKLALWELQPGLYFQKKLINRARPNRICPELPATVVSTPGHPSYPAGHAAQAYSVALLLETLFPDQPRVGVALLAAAEKVAENRVIAGIHFPSDCEAGRELALKFVPLLLGSESFQDVIAAAAEEWRAPKSPKAARSRSK